MREHTRTHTPNAVLVNAGAAAHARPGGVAPADAEQGVLGNQALQRMLAARGIQPKLEVSEPGDDLEREADAAAAAVMRSAEPDAVDASASAREPAVQRLVDAGARISRMADGPEDEKKAVTGSQREAAKASADAAAKEVKALEEKEALKKKEEEKAHAVVQPKAVPGERPHATSALESRLAARRGRGRSLSDGERAFFEPRFGRDLGGVRLHTDSEAARSAMEVRAQAFTTGRDIYFASGRYQPHTSEGRMLLAHELAHTLQQRPGPPITHTSRGGAPAARTAPAEHAPAPGSTSRTAPSPVAPAPRSVATPAVVAVPGPSPRAARSIARQADIASGAAPATVDTATGTSSDAATTDGATTAMPDEVIALDGATTFEPSPALAEYIQAAGRAGTDVRVRIASIASGTLHVRHNGGAYETVRPRHGSHSAYQTLPLTHELLQPLRDNGVEPVVALRVREDRIEGYASIATARGTPHRAALLDWIEHHTAEMGWLGFEHVRFPHPVNEFREGALRLQVPSFPFRLGGFLHGTGQFGLVNDVVTFDATTTVHVGGLTDAELDVHRDEQGALNGRVEIPVTLASFSGNVIASYGNGTVDIEGTTRYETEKLSGEVTLLVTDAATARDVALRRLGPDAVQASAEQGQGEPARGRGPRPGQRALAGWGTLDFRLTEWMTGRAEVIFDNVGHVTIVGEITPPAEIELFPQRDYVRRIFTVEVRTLYGVPVVGNVFLFANIGLDALAKLGPGKIYNIRIEGTYSTDPRVYNRFSLQATLNISAFAGLRLRAEGGAGVEIADHDIKIGAGIWGLAGLRGYVEATPTIGYREHDDPQAGRVGEFYLHGHMEIAAQPFLGLGGDLFVALDAPWWSPVPDHRWTWPLGELDYPLPGQLGIGADVDYVLGSDELPEIEFGEVDFNADRFMTDLMDDHVPHERHGEEEQPGQWAEAPTGQLAEGEPGAPPPVADSQGAPSAGQVAHGAGGAGTRESGDEHAAAREGATSPAVVKAHALSSVRERLRGGRLDSIAQLSRIIADVYAHDHPSGLRSLGVSVRDEQTLELAVAAAASAPEEYILPWAEAFGTVPPAGFATQGYSTFAAVSVNGQLIGQVVENDADRHAEAVLLDSHWEDAIARAEQLAEHHRPGDARTRVVFAINRAPCHVKLNDESCSVRLRNALNPPDNPQLARRIAGLRATTDFILAPTGDYAPRQTVSPEELQAEREHYEEHIRPELLAAGLDDLVRQLDREAMTVETADAAATSGDLLAMANAGWNLRLLLARQGGPTAFGRRLLQTIHRISENIRHVHAGS